MRRKLFAIFGVLLMSVSLFAGCNANDNDPPPEDDTEINDDVRDDGVRDNDADLNDGVDRDRTDDGDVIEDDNTPVKKSLKIRKMQETGIIGMSKKFAVNGG